MPTSLPDDVVSEILSWAPVKSACRFRCVSRGWRALISDPAFLAAHKARTEPQLLLVANYFHVVASPGPRDLRLLDPVDGSAVRVIKGVGDLQPITSDSRGPVCAARIGHFLNVTDLATGNVLMTSRVYQLYAFGIGYAAPSGACKVVRLMDGPGRPGRHTWEVVTPEHDARRWRRMQSPPVVVRLHLHLRYHRNCVVTIDGVMYFLYSLESPYFAYSSRPRQVEDHVLCLDLQSEQWKGSIKAPVRLWKMASAIRMVELNGTLCIAHSEGRGSKHACTTVWLLADLVKGLWVEAYVIPMDQTMDLVTPFRVMRHGGKLICCCLHTASASPTLQVYDPLNGTFTHLADPPGNHLADIVFCDLHLECYVRRT